MSSASHAAAMAAFKATVVKDNEKTHDKSCQSLFKYPTKTVTSGTRTSESLPYIPKTPNKRTASSKSLPKIQTNNSPNKSIQSQKSIRSIYDVKDLKLNSPLKSASAATTAAALAAANTNPSSTSSPSILTTPTQPTRSFTHSRTSSSLTQISPTSNTTVTPKDNETIRSGIDYFSLSKDSLYKSPEKIKKSLSNNSNLNINQARTQETLNSLKSSLQSKSVGKNPSLKRRSLNTAPQDMLTKVKQSIAEKSTTSNNVVESNLKNKDIIEGIRDSIDSKRITTTLAHSNFALGLEDNHLSDGSFENFPYNRPSNDSFISLGSSISFPTDNESNDQDIKSINNHSSSSHSETSVKNGTPTIFTTDFDGESFTQPVQLIRSHGSSPASPILLSSSSANAREAALGSNESLNHIHPTKYTKFPSYETTKTLSDESMRSKLKRKPPPPNVDSKDNTSSNLSRSSFDYSYTSENDDDVSKDDNDSSSRLPQFPDIDGKHHASSHHNNVNNNNKSLHNPFKKKTKNKGVDYIDLHNMDNDTIDTLHSSSSSRPSTPTINHQTQPVQLKTTMRKIKNKKTFNEDKPWKNHTDLIYITEQERKRYEGVWVSNKGQYINKIVTKLKGVSYDPDNGPIEGNAEASTSSSNLDASMKAAKLSSSQYDNIEDIKSFHGLNKVDIDGLIIASVVKRIWSRSKLPNETLEQIWDLVDYRKDGTLNKPEFLVGMWMVDQCLYGRKLPKKIENDTWSSLDSIGLSVQIKKRNKKA